MGGQLDFQFIDPDPRRFAAEVLAPHLHNASEISIAVGFLTRRGLDALKAHGLDETRVQRLLIGRATREAWKAVRELDHLRTTDRIRVHPGLVKRNGAYQPLHKSFRPMLHSKIYFMKFPDDTAFALIGSHNATQFALLGKNGEAGIAVHGHARETFFDQVDAHLNQLWAEALIFDESKVEAYVALNDTYARGEAGEEDYVSTSTDAVGLMLLELNHHPTAYPASGERIYLEIPSSADWADVRRNFDSLRRRVDLFLIPPQNPEDAPPPLAKKPLPSLPRAFAASVVSTRDAQNAGTATYEVKWKISSLDSPALVLAPATIVGRPDTYQVEVRVENEFPPFRRVEYKARNDRETVVRVEAAHEGESILDTLRNQPHPSSTHQEANEKARAEKLHSALKESVTERWYKVANLTVDGDTPWFAPDDPASLRAWISKKGFGGRALHFLAAKRRESPDADATD